MHAWILVILCANPTAVPLPGGDGGIGFDDLAFSPELGRVLAPAGRTGRLDLIDPKTLAVEGIAGFTSSDSYAHGHGEGTTSAVFGAGLLFASDRGGKQLVVIDPKEKKIVSKSPLEAGPDYVRFVAPKEVWVSEPKKKAIEWFTLDGTALTRGGSIAVEGGPESLIIDAPRARAYTHTWKEETVAIDLKAHKEIARWKNGCQASRGIALDEQHGWLFVGCEEGQATAIDVAHGGKLLGSAPAPKGVDIIAYDAKLKHLYVPGGDDAKMAVMQVSAAGALKSLTEVPTAADASCVVSDGAARAYVCDKKNGRLLVFDDRY